jgi:hypothetical protein
MSQLWPQRLGLILRSLQSLSRRASAPHAQGCLRALCGRVGTRPVNYATVFPANAAPECWTIGTVRWGVVRVHLAGRSRHFRLPPAGRDRFASQPPNRKASA